jgi:hypothetical protein
MMYQSLRELPINYLDSLEFKHHGNSAQVVLNCHEHDLQISLEDVVYFVCSGKSIDTQADYLDCIDIQHVYRKLSSQEIKKIDVSESEDMLEQELFHIISIYGGDISFQVICQKVEVKTILSLEENLNILPAKR